MGQLAEWAKRARNAHKPFEPADMQTKKKLNKTGDTGTRCEHVMGLENTDEDLEKGRGEKDKRRRQEHNQQ